MANAWDTFVNQDLPNFAQGIVKTGDDILNGIGDFFKGAWNDITTGFGKIGSGLDNVMTGDRDFERTQKQAQLMNEFSAEEAKKARDFSQAERIASQLYNTAEAEKNRQWQTQMSNTAFQRQIKDLKNAGYNPLGLIGGSGATVGSSATAHSQAGSSPSANATGVPYMHSASNVGGTISMLVSSASQLAKLASDAPRLADDAIGSSQKLIKTVRRLVK